VKLENSDCNFGYRESVFKNKYRDRFIILTVTLRLTTTRELNISYGAIRQELENMHVMQPTIRDVANAVIKIRRSKLPDPAMTGNAGSFFKNPLISKNAFDSLKQRFEDIVAFPADHHKVKLAAGWLIEQCGWKGYRRGDAGCHTQQALVLVNYGSATGKEIYQLSEEIRSSVMEKFGVELEREVNVV
jgi:UDP-N-acetylmuramate dehydrogenase